MTRTKQCDVCKRTEPEVYVQYSRRKKWWGMFKFQDDSQGGSWFELDICEQCWDKICKEARKQK